MRRLTVDNFSCIEHADLVFGRFTVLIGPQASGKSVLSKLAYFFFNLPRDQFKVLQSAGDLDELRKDLVARFKDWFPVAAWGSKRFQIDFQAGDYQIRLTRTSRKQKMGESVRVSFSQFYEQQYVSALQTIKASSSADGIADSLGVDFRITWQIQESTAKLFKERLGAEYVANQFFVPAGRAFFTSLGRAVVAFEQGRVLDPLTVQFGRIYTSLKDNARYPTRGAKSRVRALDELQEILGGKLRRIGDAEFIETTDGRRIPLSALSSGQQELLPLLFVLDFMEEHARAALIYIEEPEAHLFPSAQNRLIQELARVLVSSPDNGMVLTTHSPYVLSKINNLVKAGSLAPSLSETRANRLAEVVPRKAWIPKGMVRAYAVRDKQLCEITDPDGLIDAEYLDSVSGDIAREFSAILEIEASQ